MTAAGLFGSVVVIFEAFVGRGYWNLEPIHRPSL
jgi:hypothetical protein